MASFHHSIPGIASSSSCARIQAPAPSPAEAVSPKQNKVNSPRYGMPEYEGYVIAARIPAKGFNPAWPPQAKIAQIAAVM